MAGPAVVRTPMPIYLAELVVIHCRFEDLPGVITTLPAPLAAIDWELDGAAYMGWAEVISGFAKRGAELKRYAVLYIDANQTQLEKRLTVVHEATHLAVRLFDAIEQDITPKSDEAFAYLLEWITREGWKGCSL